MSSRIRWERIRVSNAMRRYGSVKVDDPGPIYPNLHKLIQQKRKAKLAPRIVIATSFKDLDPCDPMHIPQSFKDLDPRGPMHADSDEAGHAFQPEAGHLFRREAGRDSDLMSATAWRRYGSME
jgi:hypothetical protein